MPAKKSNTMKYLLLAGAAGAAYFFFIKPQAVTTTPANPADVAFIQSWAAGLDPHNQSLFLAALPTFTTEQVANMKALIQTWETNTAPNETMTNYWVNFSNALGLT